MKHTCQWIEGDPREPGWEFCGEPTMDGDMPWCYPHYVRVYQVDGYAAARAIQQQPKKAA